MQTRKFQVKLFAKNDGVELEKLIPVFHAWIREKRIDDELLIDVADYSHVPQGPGVVLIGHESDYYFDMADDRPGLLYSRKRGFEGDLDAGIQDSFVRALRACQLLEQEETLGLQFSTSEVLFRVQDRLAAPNDDSTLEALAPALQSTVKALFGHEPSLDRTGRERDPFTVTVSTGADGSIRDALAKL